MSQLQFTQGPFQRLPCCRNSRHSVSAASEVLVATNSLLAVGYNVSFPNYTLFNVTVNATVDLKTV